MGSLLCVSHFAYSPISPSSRLKRTLQAASQRLWMVCMQEVPMFLPPIFCMAWVIILIWTYALSLSRPCSESLLQVVLEHKRKELGLGSPQPLLYASPAYLGSPGKLFQRCSSRPGIVPAQASPPGTSRTKGWSGSHGG